MPKNWGSAIARRLYTGDVIPVIHTLMEGAVQEDFGVAGKLPYSKWRGDFILLLVCGGRGRE
jgi:hypothetical protein